MTMAFLDTNVLLRHLVGDHEVHSPRATALMHRIERGEVRVRIAETVIFETVYGLARIYRQPKDKIRDGLLALLELSSLMLPSKPTIRRAFDFYVDLNMQFADAYHAALMERLKVSQILSFDRDFDKVPGLERIEP